MPRTCDRGVVIRHDVIATTATTSNTTSDPATLKANLR